MNKQNGFTLVELLVVIAIIAILSTVAVAVFKGVTATARDSVRIKDLQTIKQALELYRSDVHNYPTTAGFNLSSPATILIYSTKTYLSPVPQDVNLVKKYNYLALPNACDNTTLVKACTDFVLCAKKEANGTSNTPTECLSLACGSAGNCDMGISSQ